MDKKLYGSFILILNGIFSLTFGLATKSFSQESFLDTSKVKQLVSDNREDWKKFREQIKSITGKAVTDVNIIFFVEPAICPRCEGFIPTLYQKALAIDPSFKTRCIGILHSEKTFVMKNYLLNQVHYDFPVYIDSENIFSNLQASNLPFVCIINDSNRLMYAATMLGFKEPQEKKYTAALTMLYKAGIISQIKDTSTGSLLSNSSALKTGPKIYLKSKNGKNILMSLHSVTLEENENTPISGFQWPIYLSKRRLLVTSEHSTTRLRAYDLESGKIKYLFPVPLQYRKLYSPTISDSEFKSYERQSLARTMVFSSCSDAEEDTIYAIGSFPKISKKMKKSDTSETIDTAVTIAVEVCINKYSFSDTGAVLVQSTPIELPYEVLPNSTLRTYVFNIYKDPLQNLFYLRAAKGFPLVPYDTGKDDISNDSFYDETPIWAVYNEGGKLLRFLGMLDSTYSILKLGYNICDPYAFFTKNGDIIYNESLSLKIYKNSEELFTLNPVMNFWDNKIIPKKWNTEEIRDLNVSKKCIVKSVFDFDTRYYSVVWFLYDSNQTASRSSFMQAKIRAKTCVIQFYNKSDFKYVDALEFSCPSDSKFVQVLPSGKNSIGLLVEGKNICSMHTLNLELDFEGGEDLVRGAPVSH